MSKISNAFISENQKSHSVTLDLGNCGLSKLPIAIQDCPWVENLIFSSEWWEYNLKKRSKEKKKSLNSGGENYIRSISILEKLVGLRKLILAGFADKWEIPDLTPLKKLQNLETLDISYSKVLDLSPLNSLQNLKELNISGMHISDISFLNDLHNLQILIFNNVNGFPDLSPLKSLHNLVVLDMSNSDIADLEPLKNLKNLKILDISNSNVYNLSPLKSLVNIEEINISNTSVDDLSFLENYVNLHTLYCTSTHVTDLLPLVYLENLRKLYASSTKIEDLTPLFEILTLEEIKINYTHVTDLSPLKDLQNLQIIDAFSTKIKDLLPLKNLQNLLEVNLSETQISDISPLLFLIERGIPIMWEDWGTQSGIYVKDCPLTIPPIEIVKQGNAAILKYIKELKYARQTGTIIRLAEAKCLILGEGGVGKTSLTRKLLDVNNPLPEEQETTKGIEVHPFDFKLTDGTDFRLNIWDFGGQEIYHATHQFFLTKRSLYILLDDTRKDEKTVDDPTFNYWLQVAELYGGDSPLLIVQNEKGDRSKELDLRGMQGRFGFVKDTKSTNLFTGRGLTKVWEAIHFWLRQLPHIGEEQPKSWLDIRRELERLAREDKRDYISVDEYYRICALHTIPERERALFLSGYLHDFGAFLHFQEHPLLRKTLVLNNQWVTDAVYRVLDSEDVKLAFGRFTRHNLATIWADNRYIDQHEELLALMEKFELCYKLPDEKTETWIAPQLLSVLQPDTLCWPEGDNLQVRYEYEFMPKGMLSQHIVRMHRYIRQPEFAWKSGVVFERADSQALVTETWGSRKINFRAKGIQSKELLTLLCEDFDKMHDRLEGLKVKKMIPCNCQVCSKAAEPHFYEYEELIERKANGKRTVECKMKPYEDVLVTGLLDGVFTKLERQESPINGTKKVFISYSKHDQHHKETLLKHLSGLRNKIVTWHDRDILPGEDWDERIKEALEDADLVLYLVTHNSLATDYIQQVELPIIEQQCMDGTCILIPVIVDFCVWTEMDFAKRNALPEKGVPITDPNWANENQAWVKVVEGIQRILEQTARL